MKTDIIQPLITNIESSSLTSLHAVLLSTLCCATRTTPQNTEEMLSLPYIWHKDKQSAFKIRQGLLHICQWVWGHMFVQFPQ